MLSSYISCFISELAMLIKIVDSTIETNLNHEHCPMLGPIKKLVYQILPWVTKHDIWLENHIPVERLSQSTQDMSSCDLWERGHIEMVLLGWKYAKGFMKQFLVYFSFCLLISVGGITSFQGMWLMTAIWLTHGNNWKVRSIFSYLNK